MKILDLLSKIAILAIFIVVSIGVDRLITMDKKETSFYNYKNVKINLKQVKKITPKIDYIITYKEDDNIDIFRKFSKPLNTKEIQKIHKALKLAQKSEFYNVEIIAYMMFDAESVTLYHSKNYLKKPTKYSVNDDLLSKLSAYGLDDYQYENLTKLKDVMYEDVNKFFDDVVSYAKLRRSHWSKENIPKLGLGANANKFMKKVDKAVVEKELEDEDIDTILQQLNNSYNHYLEIN